MIVLTKQPGFGAAGVPSAEFVSYCADYCSEIRNQCTRFPEGDATLTDPRRMMRSWLCSLWTSLAALAALMGAFWITLQLTGDPNPWALQPRPQNSVIQVVEATYGQNCLAFKPPPGIVNSVKAGNATRMVSEVCEKALETCEFFADLRQLQDPAPGCDKDLSVSWRCGNAEKVNSVRVAARADGKLVSLRCP
jgi:hypothetical protein